MSQLPYSCDTFVALPPSSPDGTVIFGKNSDRPMGEVQEVVLFPSQDNPAGSKLECTYIEIDQVEHTHAVILSKPSWMWGAEMGSNEHNVCIGNEAVWTKEQSDEDKVEKLLGMDLVRLGLERGKTAKEAMDVITTLLARHGQGGPCSDTDTGFVYHNSFLIADGKEAWIVETAGAMWAAEHITSGTRNISNQLSIGTKIDAMHPDLIKHAEQAGYWKPGHGEFNFAKAFSAGQCGMDRYERGKELLAEKSSGIIDVSDMFAILRDGVICLDRTAASQVSKLSPHGSSHLSCHWLTATPVPSQSLFKPYVFCETASIGMFKASYMMEVLRDDGISFDDGTTGSQVSTLTPPTSLVPSCHWFTATADPCQSLFKPFVFCNGANMGEKTKSPDFGDDDPRRKKPRFKSKVDRGHPLYVAHEQMKSLVSRGDPKAEMLRQQISELEKNCLQDVGDILSNFDPEKSCAKLATIFQHMVDLEINFYKMFS